MLSLLIDTSNAYLSTGLAKDHAYLLGVHYEAWQRQSEKLVAEIDELFKKSGHKPSDLTEVIVSKGPGSYTGVRIGLTVAKVVATSLDIPLYMVSSLEGLKEKGKKCLCVSNARNKRSYVGLYFDDECLIEDTIWENQKVLDYIKENPDVVLRGDLRYLGIEEEEPNTLLALKDLDDEKHLCFEPLGAKPVYLKD